METGKINVSFLLVLLLWLPCSCLAFDISNDVYRVLSERGILFEGSSVSDVLETVLVKSVDSDAVIMTEADSKGLIEGTPVETVSDWFDGLCFMKVHGLYEGTGQEIRKHLASWVRMGKSGAVIDMRGAGGADLTGVNHAAGFFVEGSNVIYRIEDYSGITNASYAVKPAGPSPFPVLVLVNGDTAGASEVFAAVVKNRAGVLVAGTVTKGDMLSREFLKLPDVRVLFVAVGRVLPGMSNERFDGVKPDLVMDAKKGNRRETHIPDQKWNGDDISEPVRRYGDFRRKLESDAVVADALDILLGLRALRE